MVREPVSAEKHCPDCFTDKPLSEFWKSRTSKRGMTIYEPCCKACKRVRRGPAVKDGKPRRVRSEPGMKFNYCPHVVPVGAPCMQCAERKREASE